MIRVRDKSECTGCSACAQACGRGAIVMRPDSQGFAYPAVDGAKCTGCGLCEEVCPVWKGAYARRPVRTLAVKHANAETRKDCASGGAFTLLAEKTLAAGGVVYGVAFDGDWNVRHVRIDRADGLGRIRGSKYVQSRVDGAYRSVREDLRKGLPVLFSGTPCQVAGLYGLVGHGFPNLTTVDLVCGSVSSPRIWRDYLKETCAAKGLAVSDLREVRFRDKREGWRKYHLTLKFETSGGTVEDTAWCCEQPYMRLFLDDLVNRPSCFACRFRGGRSGADYTMADFWGIDRLRSDFFDDDGVSLLFAYDRRNPEDVLSPAQWVEMRYEDAVAYNPSFVQDRKSPGTAFYFFHCRLGLSLARSYACTLAWMRWKERANHLARRVFRKAKRLVKRALGRQP